MIVGFVIILLFITWLFILGTWYITKFVLPNKFKIKPFKMSLLSVVLSFATALIFNLELESGLISAFVQILIFSFCWSFILLLIIFILQCGGSRHEN